jgi:hypothetical protein
LVNNTWIDFSTLRGTHTAQVSISGVATRGVS